MTAPGVVLTGGGTTGHVAVNLALIPHLLARGYAVSYLGSKTGIERSLVADFPEVTYYPISTGKLRRYFSFKNAADAFRVLHGILQARRILARLRPRVVFSKGGFVSVPVLYGARMNGIPSLTHESDVTPGLANRLCYRVVDKIFVTFEETMTLVPQNKGIYLGPIVRDQVKHGDRERGLATFGLSGRKPVLLVLGGSLGAGALNTLVRDNLDALLEHFDIVHGTGAGKDDPVLIRPGYVPRAYINEEMNDALAMADLIVSRAGSNAIFEFLYYRKPMVLLPLSSASSRGDQVQNAARFEKKGFAVVLPEETAENNFVSTILSTYEQRAAICQNQEMFEFQDGIARILEEIDRRVIREQ